jgi:16S rRNA (adenine1518-N6/adenine1519-N6)-dimethyltransferase
MDYKLVANLPYYITSPVIRKFLEIENPPKEIILMIQKEVAQRICAKPPHMNLLAVAVQFYARPKIISYVSKNSFYPQPKVDSAIIRITPKKTSEINTQRFFDLVRIGFSSKRKFLINNLTAKVKSQKSKVKNIFKKVGLDPKIRAENLSVNDWLKLYEILKK